MKTLEKKSSLDCVWGEQKITIKNFLERYIKKQKHDICVSLTLNQIKDHIDCQDNLEDFFKYCCRRYDNLKHCHSFGSVDEIENHENMMRNMEELQSKLLKPLGDLVESIARILGKKIVTK